MILKKTLVLEDQSLSNATIVLQSDVAADATWGEDELNLLSNVGSSQRPVPTAFRPRSAMVATLQNLLFWAQAKMSWRGLLTLRYSRQPLGIKVQSCPVLR